MIIKLLVDGGEMKPGPIVGQKLGPIGINIGDVISKVNQATSEFKGTKVPVALDIDPKTKKFKVEVSSPPTSELLKKEAGIETGSGDHKKSKVGNLSIEQVIKVAKVKHADMLARDFKSAVKSVVGSCASLGLLVENKEAVQLEQDIDNKVFDSEISKQKSETSAEKKTKLLAFFNDVLKKQDEAKKAEEAAKAAAEAAAALAAAGTAGAAAPAAGAAPVAGATKTPAAAPAAGAKAAEAKPAKGKAEKAK